MKIIKAKDYNGMSRMAANIISAQIIMKPNCILGLATGATPIGTYEKLIHWYQKGDLDFLRLPLLIWMNIKDFLQIMHKAIITLCIITSLNILIFI